MTGSTPTTSSSPTPGTAEPAVRIDSWVTLIPETIAIGPGFRAWIAPMAKDLAGPWGKVQESFRIGTRHLPAALRPWLDQAQDLVAIPQTLGLAHRDLLLESMQQNQVGFSVVSFPTATGTPDALIQLCQGYPLIPAVEVSSQDPTLDLSELLDSWKTQGVRALLLRTDHPRALEILAEAQEKNLRILIWNELSWKFDQVESWVRGFQGVRFALAQMNRHEPERAIELARACPNLWLMTGVQPPEMVGEAVRVLGSSRLLWSSHWPVFPDAQERSLDALREAMRAEWMSEADLQAITIDNPRRFFL